MVAVRQSTNTGAEKKELKEAISFVDAWLVLTILFIFSVIFIVVLAMLSSPKPGTVIMSWVITGLPVLWAIIIGIPVGLLFDRYLNIRAEYRAMAEAQPRERAILVAIKKELQSNLDGIELAKNRETRPFSWRQDVFRAMADSGQLQWIHDPSLLAAIASSHDDGSMLHNLPLADFNVEIVIRKPRIQDAVDQINERIKHLPTDSKA